MKYPTLILSIILFLVGCSSNPESQTKISEAMVDVPVNVEIIKIGAPESVRQVAELEIEGMTCAVGCAGLIRKTIHDMNGVVDAQINFDPDSKLDYAIVEYKPDMVSELEMAAAVQSLVDGQYKVHQIKVKNYVYDSNLKSEEVESEKTSGVDVKFSFPNILEVFTLILS
jgi:mercuric ion binding protein